MTRCARAASAKIGGRASSLIFAPDFSAASAARSTAFSIASLAASASRGRTITGVAGGRPSTRTSRAARAPLRNPHTGAAGGKQPDCVERPGKALHADRRQQPIGRLEADDAAERGGTDDRAAGLAAQRERPPARR